MARHTFKVLVTNTSITLVVLHVTLDLTKGLDICGPGDVGGAPSKVILLIPIVTGALFIGTLALTMATLEHLASRQEVSDLELGQQGLTSCVKLPQLTTGEQGVVGTGCHKLPPQILGQIGHKTRPREGLLTLKPVSRPTLSYA